ncbi:mitochondrial carrier [Epithele typhae]|uniref:mitochondrial carrier n=1 Tax=Epithele typhae TaxID=378194 RepID=UPI002008E1E2|nr:mitochondrial carrier [Epithele typhae]KAH9925952.1 mitochondrial carrier [Epithele typhae]
MTSALPPLVQACSGALASAAANTISYPLDLVATRLQTSNTRRTRGLRGLSLVLMHIRRTEGLAGLYDGLGADTASMLVSNFLYYYFYTLLHALVARRRMSSDVSLLKAIKRALTSPTPPVLLGVPAELAVGFLAGVANRAVSTPLNVVTVRLQIASEDDDEDEQDEETSTLGPPDNVAQVAHSLCSPLPTQAHKTPVLTGFRPALPLCFTPALTLLFFQLLSHLHPLRRFSSSSQSSLGAFLSGATANALAVTLLYPLLLAKVRVQAAAGKGNAAKVPTIAEVWTSVVERDGWAGLYRALGAQILKGIMSQGVTMLVKQRVERAIVRLYLRN